MSAGRLTFAVVAALVSAAALGSAPTAFAADSGSVHSSPSRGLVGRSVPSDRLTVVVRGSGDVRSDGVHELFCHPASGSHVDAEGACKRLDEAARWGKDLFAPVPPGAKCTMQYGGPATAHVTGTWAGRRVDARFDRSDGCEVGRWDALVPLLPRVTTMR